MGISELAYSVSTITASRLSDYIGDVDSPELAVNSSAMLIRTAVRKFETFKAMSHLVDGDEILRNMLRSDSTRKELEVVISSIGGLESVLETLFGSSGQAEPKSPRYSSMNVIQAVENAKQYKSVGVNTRLLIAACLNDMLDVFGMRQESASASWIETHSADLSPTLDDLINELLEAGVADRIKHILMEFRKKAKDTMPTKRFNIFAYTQLMHIALRDITLALNAISYREVWLRDILQMIGRHVVNDRTQIATYGDPRGNPSIMTLLSNSTVVRLAMSVYDRNHVCTIPAHEVRNEADYIARNLSSLTNYDIVTNAADVIQLSGYHRSQTGALVSAVINGVRKSKPDAHVYTIIDHGTMGNDFVDVINKTKEYSSRIPTLPAGIVDRFVNDTIIVAEELAMASMRTKYTSLSLATANVDDAMLHDVVAMLCPVSFSKVSDTFTATYMVVDTDSRLRAISPSNFEHMNLTNAALAFAAVGNLSETVVTKPLFSSEALLMDGRFTGVWADRKTTPITDVNIVIVDLLNSHEKDKAVPSVEVPLFGSARALPRFTEVSSTDGWSDIIQMLNNIGSTLNSPGNQKTKLQRTAWVTSVITLLADWANKDVALHSLIGRAVSAFSAEAQRGDLPEEYYMVHSYYHGMIALQCALEVLNTMAGLNDSTVELSENVREMLLSAESMLAFSTLVSTN